MGTVSCDRSDPYLRNRRYRATPEIMPNNAATRIAVVAMRNWAVERVRASVVCSAAFARQAMLMMSVRNFSVVAVRERR
jgi:hypothetical protein